MKDKNRYFSGNKGKWEIEFKGKRYEIKIGSNAMYDLLCKVEDRVRKEEREHVIAELSVSENMEKIETFFRESPIDYDDKCRLWWDFIYKLLKRKK
jgi:hypothetical protein